MTPKHTDTSMTGALMELVAADEASEVALPIPGGGPWFPAEDRAEILRAIDACLLSGRLTLGPLGDALEEAFASYTGATHAVAVSSGTAALEIVFRALGVEGREVLVPTNTFVATAAAAIAAGARVRLIDCDPNTLAVQPDALLSAINADTAAAVVVHIGGMVAPETARLVGECASRGVPVVEDAAHAHGSRFDGRHAGTFGVAGAFSFYPTKVMTSAEGGMIITEDAAIVDVARVLRDQGKASFTQNFHVALGANWRMSEPHAAIAGVQLRRLDEMLARRRAIAATYHELLNEALVRPQPIPVGSSSNFYKFVAFVPDLDRDELRTRMQRDHGVSLAGGVYDTPLHRQPVFAHLPAGEFPGADWIAAHHICLPISPGMTEGDAVRVVEALHETAARPE